MVELTPGSGVYLYQHDIDYVQRVRKEQLPMVNGLQTPHEHILHKERLS